ncbi:hypothetical protein OEZ85_013082 [Tetradesmus obliquus]|uniref:Zinc/iron permease n=1 Tax=Tetradesmus obliquus TaxID=3088 RepID=A0ABY8U4K6_TETOB|nr:hypothetical protein OEZ85_013082 [Tetradesmus obliquus]
MFVGAYGCGMLPSWLPISEQRLASVNALGAGLLLGSALVIILPEGFEAAMEAHEESHLPEWGISLSLLAGFWFMLMLDTAASLLPSPSSSSSSSSAGQPPDFGDAADQQCSDDEHEPAQQALLGLMVHAASDGLAVGAASLAAEPAVGLGVAAAMVVHKGPVAVGLAAYLRSARWSASRVHTGMLLFLLASPAAVLVA